ncbi:MAG: hypothetical protein GWP59_07795 [Chlamydiales bacterium]|nr:branched-chain amino acid transport system II carrier protein [Chlamydiales bacterium]NCF71588.1 hypothetical protein [Chlamydiales bacterium]
MKKQALILGTGFAMFSMFFGSGNLVFPVLVGQQSNGHFAFASLGIFLTGVLVPFLGAIAMLLFKGKTEEFFGVIGKKASFIIPLFALSLMGPFGVLARCITVAHGSYAQLFPQVSLPMFSFAFCTIVFFATIKKSRVVTLLGGILTPILLLSLLLIAYQGLLQAELPPMEAEAGFNAFKNGIFQGYQTMDLLAAFFFSTFVLQHIQSRMSAELTTSTQLFKLALSSSLIGMTILSFVYFLLVMLGATYANQLSSIAPEKMLGFIANLALGTQGSLVVCIAIVVACFTTGVVLSSLFADFIKKEISCDKLSFPLSSIITLVVAFSVSTLEFQGIASFICPILETIYPALIVLTVLNLANKLRGTKVSKWPIALALFFRILAS